VPFKDNHYPEIPGLQILSLTATERRNYMINRHPMVGDNPPYEGLNIFNVTIIYTHPGWNDETAVVS
jgi:hypothetical protein